MTTATETAAPAPRTVRLTVSECSHVVDSRGNDQWKLKVDVPWSQYAETMYLDYAVPDGEPKISQQYPCVVSQRNIKKNQDGTEKDPQHDYNWWWKIDQWDVASTEPVTNGSGQVKDNAPEQTPYAKGEVVVGTPLAYADPTRVSIERQVALKAAVEIATAHIAGGGKIDSISILDQARSFYDWISQTPAAPDMPASAPESPPEAATDAQVHEATMIMMDAENDGGGNVEPPLFPDEPEEIDTLEQFGALMKQWGVTREQAREYLGGKDAEDWIGGPRTINAAAIRIKERHGEE